MTEPTKIVIPPELWEHPPILPTSRMEAIEWAADFCEKRKIFEPPMNRAGYSVGDWKAPSGNEKLIQLQLLADWLLGKEDDDESGY